MKPRHPTLSIPPRCVFPRQRREERPNSTSARQRIRSLWAVSGWRSLAAHRDTCHVSVARVEDLTPMLRGESWVLPGFTTGHRPANLLPLSAPWPVGRQRRRGAPQFAMLPLWGSERASHLPGPGRKGLYSPSLQACQTRGRESRSPSLP